VQQPLRREPPRRPPLLRVLPRRVRPVNKLSSGSAKVADPAFYTSRGPFSIAQIEKLTRMSFEPSAGLRDVSIHDVAPLDGAGPGQLSFCDRPKFATALNSTTASACFVLPALAGKVPAGVAGLVTPAPHLAFCAVASALYPDAGLFWDGQNPPLSAIDPSARLGVGAVCAPGVFLGPGVEIGDGTVVGPGCVIGRGVKIGRNCRIDAQVSIAYALIGDGVVIQSGARIGSDGFGFAPSPQGLTKVPQLGRVILQDRVEIGANATIDRGALADTVIGEGTKLDNMVHVGHNVRIGRYCVIAAQTGISGSSTIGDFVMMGGQTGVADHVSIGGKTQIAARGGVTRSLPGGQIYGGFPAKPVRDWRRETATLARLAKKRRDSGDDGTD
jgi:UDP-3-O-[3-hydroxymyristoyl] glucosamine N-acyltransferase